MKPARGFRFALEPVGRQRAMALDDARSKLATIQSRLDEARVKLRASELKFAAARADWTCHQEGQSLRLHHVTSAYLRDLGNAIVEQATHVTQIEREHAEATAVVLECHRDAEVVERHRQQALREHALEGERKTFAEADEAYIQRIGRETDVA